MTGLSRTAGAAAGGGVGLRAGVLCGTGGGVGLRGLLCGTGEGAGFRAGLLCGTGGGAGFRAGVLRGTGGFAAGFGLGRVVRTFAEIELSLALSSLCNLCVLCVSVVPSQPQRHNAAEPQPTIFLCGPLRISAISALKSAFQR